MEAAQIIRDAVARVAALRQRQAARPELAASVAAVKAFQARRFAGSYADLLASGTWQGAARFFLEELYSDRDYAARDAQFARIAGALQTLFPDPVVATAVSLARLHALTEELDHAMALCWLAAGDGGAPDGCARYVAAWRAVGRRADRESQLQTVQEIGRELARLTRMRGLRTMLRMMRRPAQAAGLASLQGFLESGFDTFGEMSRQRQGVEVFLALIQEREAALIGLLFSAEAVACETELAAVLGQAR